MNIQRGRVKGTKRYVCNNCGEYTWSLLPLLDVVCSHCNGHDLVRYGVGPKQPVVGGTDPVIKQMVIDHEQRIKNLEDRIR